MFKIKLLSKKIFLILISLSLIFQMKTFSQIDKDMVLIQAGEFIMGKNKKADASPEHKVILESFYMDKYEVTNAQYFKFCQETKKKLPEFWGMVKYFSGIVYPKHPVVGINWRDAEAYAKWAGKRLPTEAEWEYAARGGLIGKEFPNGKNIDSSKANYTIKGESKGAVAVGSYSPNGFGLYDMAGNVCEWVADWYDKDCYKNSPRKNPKGPKDGKFKVFRGGGWHSGPGCINVFRRNALPSNWVDFNVGFRCVKDYK